MKVGDLVQLSAYGRKRGYNIRIWKDGNAQRVGLIVRVFKGGSFPYEVRWAGMKKDPPKHMRMELKYAYR